MKKQMPISNIRVPIPEEVKERIIKRMVRLGEGLLTAAKASQISPTRVMDDLMFDEPFMKKVERARMIIAEQLSEELITIADQPAHGRDQVSDKALRLKARYWMMEKLIPRFKPAPSSLSLQQTNIDQQHVTITAEQQKAMAEARAQFDRLYNNRPDAVDAEIVEPEPPRQQQPKQQPRELPEPLPERSPEPSQEPVYLRSRPRPWIEADQGSEQD
jgi:terminase small subunit-like protein